MSETEVWTAKAALDWTQGYLDRKGDEHPRLSAERLLSSATGLTRMGLYTQLDRPLSKEELATFREYVSRRGAGEPIQYILGSAPFRHIELKVRPGVLIPRPETEVLVSEVLAALPKPERMRAFDSTITAYEGDELAAGIVPAESEKQDAQESEDDGASVNEQLLVADLCTGSGCIACSIAYENPLTKVVATDISHDATELAKENIEALGLSDRVYVIECDLGSGVASSLMGEFDAVVSNPPYVPANVLAEVPKEVSEYEPELALYGGEDGLDVFRSILDWSKYLLKANGLLAVELHETCLDEALRIAKCAGFEELKITNDLAGKPRVLTGRSRGRKWQATEI